MKPNLNICFCCVGTKAEDPEIAQMYDCVVGPTEWKSNAAQIEPKFKAIDLYQGPGFEIVRRTIAKLEAKYEVTAWIFSAGWGILHQDDLIPSYSATFSSSDEDRIMAVDQKEWINDVTQHRLPKGTVCCFPESYAKPYRRCFDDIDDMILIQGSSEDRADMDSPMIRTTVMLMEGIATHYLDNTFTEDHQPENWPDVRGIDIYIADNM